MVFAHSNEINSRVYFKLYHQNGIMSVIYQWDYAVRLKISIYGVAYESNSISWYCHQKKPATSNMVDNIKSPKNQIFFFSPKVDPKSKLFFLLSPKWNVNSEHVIIILQLNITMIQYLWLGFDTKIPYRVVFWRLDNQLRARRECSF